MLFPWQPHQSKLSIWWLFRIKFRSCLGTSILLIKEDVFLFMPIMFPQKPEAGCLQSDSSLVTLDMQSPHVFWRLYTLKSNTVMKRNKHAILRVSISVVWFQTCAAHIKSCLARIYIPKAWRQVKMTFVPAPVKVNYTQAKAYCPISRLSIRQKTVQIWWQEYQGWNNGACSHIYNNLPSYQGSPQKLQCTTQLHIYRKH